MATNGLYDRPNPAVLQVSFNGESYQNAFDAKGGFSIIIAGWDTIPEPYRKGWAQAQYTVPYPRDVEQFVTALVDANPLRRFAISTTDRRTRDALGTASEFLDGLENFIDEMLAETQEQLPRAS